MPMNTFSKILLSADEQQLVTNTGWILTKRKIMEKVNILLGDVAEQQKRIIANESGWLPGAVVQSTPKIAKGENYLQLPYLLLDYPRCFDSDQIFAVRTMFWWGNFFSITLHLSGRYKKMFQQNIIQNIQAAEQDIFICIHEDQWQHHFEAHNYREVKKIMKDELQVMITEKSFIKLAIKFPLQTCNEISSLLDGSFTELMDLLKD
jgi:hypothetical protein